MKFFKKASTSSPPPTQINEEIPKKNLFQPIKQFFHFNRLEMKFLWWIFLASMFWSVYLISPLSKPKAIYVYGNRQVEVETIREQAGMNLELEYINQELKKEKLYGVSCLNTKRFNKD